MADYRQNTTSILTTDALAFVAALTREFGPQVEDILTQRAKRQDALDAGERPDFLSQTRSVRDADWQVCAIPSDLQDRRVEITGPTDRKMIINALNSGARVFMADCEDSLTPDWDNVIRGQINLRDAAARTIELDANGKHYSLNSDTATLIVRPRGWHLPEKHLLCDDQPVPGALVDFGLYLFHNAERLSNCGTGPYFYLPKIESHVEARLWNDVFRFSERFGIVGEGEIKVTVLIETILAAFEIDEILYELRNYIVGMNCGRWDYIFSFIKKFRRFPEFVLPDRAEVTMTSHFLRAYSQLVIKTCHRRGALPLAAWPRRYRSKTILTPMSWRWPRFGRTRNARLVTGTMAPGWHILVWCPWRQEIFDTHMPGTQPGWQRCAMTCRLARPTCYRCQRERLPSPG